MRTLAARLGPLGSSRFYAALLLLPYGASLYAAATRSLVRALPLLTLRGALALVDDMRHGRFVGLPKRTAKLQFLFGVLLTAGHLIPSPSLASLVKALGAKLASALRAVGVL